MSNFVINYCVLVNKCNEKEEMKVIELFHKIDLSRCQFYKDVSFLSL